MAKKAKRHYTAQTLRSLWIKSGNQCAHPKCQNSLLDDAGIFVGEISHIEGLNPGSARYNQKMTDEERNSAANLILLCATHHTEVDKNQKRTVADLKKWKFDHEKKYSDIANIFQGVLSDYTEGMPCIYPSNLGKLKCIGLLTEKEEIQDSVSFFCEVVDKLKPVPHATKSFLAIAISRAHKESSSKFVANIDEICEVATISKDIAKKHIDILDIHRLAFYDDDDEFGRNMLRILPHQFSKWHIWEDVQSFFKRDSEQLKAMLLDMDFSRLDK